MFIIPAIISTAEKTAQLGDALKAIAPDADDKSYAVATFRLKIVDWVLKPLGLDSDKTAILIIYAIVVFAVAFIVGYVTQWIVIGVLRKFGHRLGGDLYQTFGDKAFPQSCF